MVKNMTKSTIIERDPGQFTVHRVQERHEPGRQQSPCVIPLIKQDAGQDRQDQAQARHLVRRYAMTSTESGDPLRRSRPQPLGDQISDSFVRSGKKPIFQTTTILCGDGKRYGNSNFAQFLQVCTNQGLWRLPAQTCWIVTTMIMAGRMASMRSARSEET